MYNNFNWKKFKNFKAFSQEKPNLWQMTYLYHESIMTIFFYHQLRCELGVSVSSVMNSVPPTVMANAFSMINFYTSVLGTMLLLRRKELLASS